MSESALSGRPYFSGEIPARVGGGLGGFLKWKKGGKEKKKNLWIVSGTIGRLLRKKRKKRKRKNDDIRVLPPPPLYRNMMASVKG